jgi:hypothetical protein
MQLAGGTPGDCGSWQTPAKLSGKRPQARWIMSLQCRDQCRLVVALPMWCAMRDAVGENSVRSVPRSRCRRSCAPSSDWRISSSLIASVPLLGSPARTLDCAVEGHRERLTPA